MKLVRRRKIVLAWMLRILVLGCVVLVWLFPPLSVLSRETDAATILNYDAAYELQSNGDLLLTETLDVELPPGKRGIFRIFDTKDPRRSNVQHPVDVVSVTRDGEDEPWVWNESAAGTQSIRIGAAGNIIGPGEFTYEIVSRTTGALEPAPGGPGRDGEVAWWWDVVGSGWQMPIESASVTASLPAVPRTVECVQDVDTRCEVSSEGQSLSLSAGPLAPYTPVTVRAIFPAGALPVPPGSSSIPLIVLVVGAVLLGAGAAAALWFATRERAPGFPVLFEPPAGVSPAVGVRVLQEEDAAEDLQALLFELGGRGIVSLSNGELGWQVRLEQDPAAVGVTIDEQGLLLGLGLVQTGDSFTVAETVASGETISTTLKSMRRSVAEATTPYLAPSWPGIIGRLLTMACITGVLVATGIHFFSTSHVPLALVAFLASFSLVGAGLAVDKAVRTKHSDAGRELWTRVGGFARFLSTESSEARFDAAAHRDWYPRYLGWATALGVAAEWASRFEAQGVDVSTVPYVTGYGVGHGFSASDLTSSVASAITGASATYAASVSSSAGGSFGGGGFSGGSGGGGGGGGSW